MVCRIIVAPSAVIPYNRFIVTFRVSLLFIEADKVTGRGNPFGPGETFIPVAQVTAEHPSTPVAGAGRKVGFENCLLGIAYPAVFFFRIIRPKVAEVFHEVEAVGSKFIGIFDNLCIIAQRFFCIDLGKHGTCHRFGKYALVWCVVCRCVGVFHCFSQVFLYLGVSLFSRILWRKIGRVHFFYVVFGNVTAHGSDDREVTP